MTLYLDCEFNGHGGSLISMAIVSDVDGEEFYLEVDCKEPIHPWVKENVIPKLIGKTAPRHNFIALLVMYLNKHIGEDIVADWPHDFTLLMNEMAGPNYESSYLFPCTMRLINSGPTNPEIPHFALSDAKALMRYCLENKI